MDNKKVGLFFGSFNPVHIGHRVIANYYLQFTDLDEVWFVLSPHSPHKNKSGLVDPWLRLEMLRLALNDAPGYQVCDIELYLSRPSYTSVTLAFLTEKYPRYSFALLMGADNYFTLGKWYNYKAIVEHYPLYVYPRPGVETDLTLYKGASVTLVEAPLMKISSSEIRKALREKRDIRFFLPEKVYDYICTEQLYL